MQIEEMNVLMVMPSLSGGGAERVAVALSKYLTQNNASFTFLLTKSNEIAYELPDDVKVLYEGFGSRTSPVAQIRAIRNALRCEKYSVAISFLPFQNIYSLIAGVGIDVKTVVSIRNYPACKSIHMLLKNVITRVAYSVLADGIVFQTSRQAKLFPVSLQNKGVVIPNPLSSNLPERCRENRRNVITASGRLTQQKNYPMMLKAFKNVHDQYPEYELEIYGSGELESALKTLSAELGIRKYVHFKGFQEDAMERIASSALFVMTSDWEGMSNSLMEALAMGVPVVCTRCQGGGAEELIVDGVNGLLVDRNDVLGLSNAICAVLDDPDMACRLSTNAQRIKEKLSFEKVGRNWAQYLLEISSNNECVI